MLLLAAGLTAPAADLNPGWARARSAAHLSRELGPLPADADSDIIVGDPDPNEVKVITGRYVHSGRIIIVNNGRLILDSADFTLRGDAWVYNHGTLLVRRGRFTIAQTFAYQYSAAAVQGGTIEFDSTAVEYGGFSSGVAVADSARFSVEACTLRQGFCTVSLMGRGRVDYRGSDFQSEYVVFDSCRVGLRTSHTALIWLGFPELSCADLSLPSGDTLVRHWEIHPGSPGVTGISYSVTLDSVTDMMWGTFPMRGCSVTIRDSRLRTTGVMVQGSDSVRLTGVMNNQHYSDYRLGLADRAFRLVNTDLATWNLYPMDSVRFYLESSVFGEMLAMGAARATITNAICDGSGGYIGAEGTSQLLFVSSMVNSQVVSRDRSVIAGALSTIHYGSVRATDGSALVLMFCSSEYDPRPLDTAIVYVANFSIPDGSVPESFVPVIGTADIRPGPYNPLTFGRYRFDYAVADSPVTWHPFGRTRTEPVADDTLELWDTHGLAPGTYLLRITLSNSQGDSLDPSRAVHLVIAGLSSPGTVLPAALPGPTPNPFRGRTVFRAPPASGPVAVSVFDASGRRVRALAGTAAVTWDGRTDAGTPAPAGVYSCRVTIGRYESWHRVTLTR